MGSVNQRHLNSNMNPAVFVILAVVGLSAAAPQPSGHGSSFKHKTQCHTTYKRTYETVYEDKCHTVYDTDYKTEYEKACETFYETTYETACDVTYKKECYGYGYDKKCKSVPVEKCHQIPVQVPVQVPIQVPVQVPREVCESIPKQVAKQIPEKKCDSYGHGH